MGKVGTAVLVGASGAHNARRASLFVTSV